MPTFTGRIASGTAGLDEFMGAGIPAADATLVMGPSGAGKTIFSLRYISEGLARGVRCLYITFQDTADQLVGMAAGFGWDFEAARADGRLTIEHVPMGTLDLDVLVSVIRQHLTSRQALRERVTSETTTLGPIHEPLHGLMFLFHNVVQIRYVERHANVGRVMNILKMRNSWHDTGIYLCTITGNGLEIGERLEGVSGVLGWSVLTEG
jgi:circadian clock protein KaiC